jgi:hypothetical protein
MLLFRIQLLVLISLVCSCATRSPDAGQPNSGLNAISRFEASFPVATDEWKRLCVRDPSLPIVNESYLKNLHASVTEVFSPWFEGDPSVTDLPYMEMLRTQHAHLISGNGSASTGRYDGATMIMHNLGTQMVPAGRFRFEIYGNEPNQRIPMSFQIERKLTEGLSDRIQSLRAFYNSQPEDAKDPEPDHDGPDKITHHIGRNAALEVLPLPGIPQERVKVWNMIYGGWATHYYVRLADTPIVLEAMGKALKKLRGLEPSKEQLKENFSTLERYLYLGIHAHPFESGNFSLIMSQVNYILWRHGYRGISHGSLDFYGVLERFEDFQRRFRKSVNAVNPQQRIPLKRDSRARELELNILAHVSWAGDLYFSQKAIVEDPNDREHSIEGLKIMPLDLPGDVRLEYMAHISNAGDTAWQEAGTFLGTTGECKAMEGLALRLVGDAAEGFDVFYQARLGVGTWTPIAKSGGYCGSKGEGLPVTGLRI